ncbi:hypothetical protein AWC11_11295 [Mycobacterium interjectum]|nr:hypothetical protein AWC11_11295 [Mycobacterium interjectum]
MEDVWTSRDLPVLKAAVEIYDRTGGIRPDAIERAVGLDPETVQRALRALHTEPYFRPEGTKSSFGGDILIVGAPTSDAYRVAGAWPTPENLLERLITAFEAAGEDNSRDEPERNRFKQTALWLGSAASQVAISALGGAGGHMLSG